MYKTIEFPRKTDVEQSAAKQPLHMADMDGAVRRKPKATYMDYENGMAIVNGKEFSLDEVLAAISAPDSFCGKHCDPDKIQKFMKLAKLAGDLKTLRSEVVRIESIRPERRSRHANVMVDCEPVISFDEEDMTVLREMMQLADGVSVIPIAVNKAKVLIRASFEIMNLWR